MNSSISISVGGQWSANLLGPTDAGTDPRVPRIASPRPHAVATKLTPVEPKCIVAATAVFVGSSRALSITAQVVPWMGVRGDRWQRSDGVVFPERELLLV